MKRYWEIEFLRGVAALIVVLNHYSFYVFADNQNAPAAMFLHYFHSVVELFFVLSGFVFAPYWLGQMRMPWRRFLAHRVFRIYPLYLVSLLILVLFSRKPLDWSIVLQHVFFVQTMHSNEAATYYSLAYWTLPVEWEFYLLSTLLLALLARFAWQPSQLERLALCLTLASAALLIWAGWVLPASAALFFGHTPVLLCEIMMGVWAYWSLQPSGGQKNPAPPSHTFSAKALRFFQTLDQTWRAWELPLVAGFWLVLLWLYWHDPAIDAEHLRPLGGFTWASSVMYALLLRWLIRHEVLSSRFPKFCARLGEMSYGLYVFHAAIGAGMVTLFRSLGWSLEWALMLAMVVGVVVGLLCFRFVEAPMMRWGKQWARRF